MERSVIIADKHPEKQKTSNRSSSQRSVSDQFSVPSFSYAPIQQKTRVTHVTKSDSGHMESFFLLMVVYSNLELDFIVFRYLGIPRGTGQTG